MHRLPAPRPAQLCGLLASRPQLAEHYATPLQQLVLWGAADDPGQSGVVRGLPVVAAAEVLWGELCPA